MADPTLQRAGATFLSSGSNTITFTNTQTETFTKSSNLLVFAMPGSDASGALIFDLLGVSNEITIAGVYTSSDGTVSDFTSDLDTLNNGAQAGDTYTPSSINRAVAVYVNDATWDWVAGEPNTITYRITLYEASP